MGGLDIQISIHIPEESLKRFEESMRLAADAVRRFGDSVQACEAGPMQPPPKHSDDCHCSDCRPSIEPIATANKKRKESWLRKVRNEMGTEEFVRMVDGLFGLDDFLTLSSDDLTKLIREVDRQFAWFKCEGLKS